MRGMGPGILDNPPRPIYPESVEYLLTNLVSRHASIRVIDDPLRKNARILDDPLARHPARDALNVWALAPIDHRSPRAASLMSCLPIRDISID